MLGNFHDDVINIECETNSADLYVVDAEGVYIENIAMHSYLESDVIDAINTKYGTNFTHLTMQKVTGIAIGDDCPNWNAYEKIEMPINGWFKTLVSGSIYTYGKVENNVLTLYGKINEEPSSELGLPIVSEVGKITSFSLHQSFKDVISQRIGNITQSYIVETSLNIGDDVENWKEMTLVE